jgi:hypothetical protein
MPKAILATSQITSFKGKKAVRAKRGRFWDLQDLSKRMPKAILMEITR